MGFIERIQNDRKAEQRVIGGIPWRLRPWDDPFWKFSQGGPVHPSRAFFGEDRALGLPALYSCVRIIAESIASLPLKLYMRNPGGGPAIRYTGPSIFDRPSVGANLYDWLYQCMTSLLLYGNAWGFVTGRDGFGYPTGIDWIPPDRVSVVDDSQQPWNTRKTRVYVQGRLIENWQDELIHIRAFTVPGRTEGISPLRAFAMTLMSGLEIQRYGIDWFAAGGFPPGTFQNKNLEVDVDASNAIKQTLVSSIQSHQPLVFGADWEYKPLSVPPAEAQFLESIQGNATLLAAVYGLPPDSVGGRRGDSLTYNTVEQSTLQVIQALRPWMVRLETAFFDLIPANRYARFNPDALLKTDLKTRTDIHQVERNMGLLTIDEIRDKEDLSPLPGGAGNEFIPLEVMIAMARSIRGIPKSMLSGIVLEMDLEVERLEKLQKEGIAAPDVLPSAKSPAAILGTAIGQTRDMGGGSAADDLLSLLRQALRDGRSRMRDDEPEKKEEPEFIGMWIPPVREARETSDPASDTSPVPYSPEMYTAHRLDELTRNLTHATERLTAARTTTGDERAYETDHVLMDIGEAVTTAQRLVRNIRENYPEESNEFTKIVAMTGPDQRAVALSPAHKSATFAHLLQTILYDQGHALRHAQAMHKEEGKGDDALWNFDAEHCAKHALGALSHARKLTAHIKDNYPEEARWLSQLRSFQGQWRMLAGTNGNNGNGHGDH